MTLSTPASARLTSRTRMSALAVIWIVVVSLVPIMRILDARLSVVVDLLTMAMLLLGRVRAPFGAPLWVIAAILVPIAGMISGQSSDLQASVQTAISLAITIGILPFVLRYLVLSEPGWARKALTGFLTVQTLSAIAGLMQAHLGLEILGRVANEGRANGLSGHPNVLGIMATVAILTAIAAFPRASTRLRVVLAAVAGLNLSALLATGSLSNLLALGVGLSVLVLAMRVTIKALLILLAAIALLVVLQVSFGLSFAELTSGVQARVDDVTGQTGDVGSLQIREATWANAWQLILSDPFVGAGMDATNQAVYGQTVVHNFVLRYWYQGGLVLLASLALWVGVLVVALLRALARGKDGGSVAAIAAILAFAVTSAFYNSTYYWIPLLLAVALYAIPDGSPGVTAQARADLPERRTRVRASTSANRRLGLGR